MYGSEDKTDSQLTKYGILRNVQQVLSEIRTDLDSFHETEAYALMYSGYRQTKLKLEMNASKNSDTEDVAKPEKPLETRKWEFLKMQKFMTNPQEADKLLEN